MAIYINDHRGAGADARGAGALLMCLPMLRHAGAALPGAVWLGALGIQGETGTVRPLWLWRKGAAIAGAGGATTPAPLYVLLAERLLRAQTQAG